MVERQQSRTRIPEFFRNIRERHIRANYGVIEIRGFRFLLLLLLLDL